MKSGDVIFVVGKTDHLLDKNSYMLVCHVDKEVYTLIYCDKNGVPEADTNFIPVNADSLNKHMLDGSIVLHGKLQLITNEETTNG